MAEGTAASDPRWLIVGGAPRSGTTLVYRLLKQPIEVGLRNEKGLLNRLSAENQARLLRRLSHKHHRQFGRLPRLIGEKRPEYYEIPLAKRFGSNHPLVIHVSRRPSDVIRSMMQRTAQAKRGQDDTWSPFFAKRDATDCWLRAWRFAIIHADEPWFLHIKYEDLVAEPSLHLKRMGAFLSLELNDCDASFVDATRARRDHERVAEHYSPAIAAIEQAWDKPLPTLERSFAKLAPSILSRPRRLARRFLWQLTVASRRGGS